MMLPPALLLAYRIIFVRGVATVNDIASKAVVVEWLKQHDLVLWYFNPHEAGWLSTVNTSGPHTVHTHTIPKMYMPLMIVPAVLRVVWAGTGIPSQ